MSPVATLLLSLPAKVACLDLGARRCTDIPVRISPAGLGRTPQQGLLRQYCPPSCITSIQRRGERPGGAEVFTSEQPERTCRTLRAPQRPASRGGSPAPLASASPAELRGSPLLAAGRPVRLLPRPRGAARRRRAAAGLPAAQAAPR